MEVTKRVIVSYKNLKPEVLRALKQEYPEGYDDYVKKIDKGNGEHFYAITLDFEDTRYMIKVDVKVDNVEELEKQIFSNSDDSGDDVSDPEIPDDIADSDSGDDYDE